MQMFKSFFGFFSLLLLSTPLFAETVKTDVEGLVIKNFECGFTGDHFFGNIVNRSNKRIDKTVIIKVYDSDGDPIGSCSSSVKLEANSGNRFSASSCNCLGNKNIKVKITTK